MEEVYVLKIELTGSSPKIWRRVEVPSDCSFFQLHQIIQAVMFWENYHLHAFKMKIGRDEIEIQPNENGSTAKEKKIYLSEYMEIVKEIIYIYDFGDYWEHKIKLENVKDPEKGVIYPRCIGGKNATPPEDCGGIDGYYDMLNIIKGKDCSSKDEILEWLGEDFDPAEFDASLVKFPKRLCRVQE